MAATRSRRPGYELSDVSPALVAAIVAGLALFIVATPSRRPALVPAQPPRPAHGLARRGAAGASARGRPGGRRRCRRSREAALLGSYGWVDRSAGIVRMPVERRDGLRDVAAGCGTAAGWARGSRAHRDGQHGYPLWPVPRGARRDEIDLLLSRAAAGRPAADPGAAVLVLLFVFAIRYRAGSTRRPRPSHQEKLALGGRHGRRRRWSLSSACSSGAPHLYVDCPRRTGRCAADSMSSPSNGCGRCSTRAASARSTSCTCPSGRPVRLIMTSQDVIHSFFMPAFRIKQDVVPGRYTTSGSRRRKAGVYHLFCAEYLRHRPFAHDRPRSS